MAYLSWGPVFTLDVGGLTSVSLWEKSKLVITPWNMEHKKKSLEAFHIYSLTLAWTGLGRVVWLPLATLDSPVVHAVVVDGVSQGHLLVTGCQGQDNR